MPTQLRKLGVHGVNVPSKKSLVVTPADFSIGGIIGKFERAFDQAFKVRNIAEQIEIFGQNVNSLYYGFDVANSFWQNLAGISGSLYIKSHVGYNGSAIDAVNATSTLTDQNGLASALAAANEMRTKINAHAADASNHTTAIDNVNFPLSSGFADNLAGLLTLVNEILVKYPLHETDAAKASLWAYHKAQETGTHALTSVVAATTLTDCLTRLADIKTKYNAHDADASAHGGSASSHQLTLTASATPASTLIIKAAYKSILEYGISGNRTGVKILNGIRFTTALTNNVAASDTSAVVDSVAGMAIGDLVVFKASGTASVIVIKKITSISEGTHTIG